MKKLLTTGLVFSVFAFAPAPQANANPLTVIFHIAKHLFSGGGGNAAAHAARQAATHATGHGAAHVAQHATSHAASHAATHVAGHAAVHAPHVVAHSHAWGLTLENLGSTLKADAARVPQLVRDALYTQLFIEAGKAAVGVFTAEDAEVAKERILSIEQELREQAPVTATRLASVRQSLGSSVSKEGLRVELQKALAFVELELDWTPGTPHPTAPGIVASDKKMNFRPANGFTWLNDTAGDLRVVSKLAN